MPGVVCDAGELRMLATALGIAPAESLALRLYVNDHAPGLPDVAADYTEMTTHGYTVNVLVAGAWTLVPAAAGLNTPAQATAARQMFVFSVAAAPVDVYGYYLTGLTSGELWGAQRFTDGPYRVENAGDQIDVTPSLRLRSEYP